MLNDAELVAAALSGGPEAFGPIVDRYRDAVFGVALSRVGDFDEAEDIAQNVFVEAYQGLKKLKDTSRLGTWLRRMTVGRSIDELRKRRPSVGIDEIADTHPEEQPHTGVHNDLREEVLAAIGRLSKIQRETVTLFYINGYSVSEVAQMQEVPEGTIKGRLHDARKKLKEEMMKTVEGVLKSGAPKEDFSARVFQLLNHYPFPPSIPWRTLRKELQKIGSSGIDGFITALEAPYSKTRRAAVAQLDACSGKGTTETIFQLLKVALNDTDKTVRRFAEQQILQLEIDPQRKRTEVVPLVVPLLFDRSKRVRRAVAWNLRGCGCVDAVPVEEAARAVLQETDKLTREWKEGLLSAVIEARNKQQNRAR